MALKFDISGLLERGSSPPSGTVEVFLQQVPEVGITDLRPGTGQFRKENPHVDADGQGTHVDVGSLLVHVRPSGRTEGIKHALAVLCGVAGLGPAAGLRGRYGTLR